MAQFRVGQRVKMIAHDHHFIPYGAEGILVARGNCIEWIMRFEGRLNTAGHSSTVDCGWGVHSHEIAPLTDPKADSFIESLKKLAREPLAAPPAVLDGVIEAERT